MLDPDFPFGAAAAVHPSGCIITSDTPEREYTALFQMIYRTFVENRPTAASTYAICFFVCTIGWRYRFKRLLRKTFRYAW